jgi:hypothetical protein
MRGRKALLRPNNTYCIFVDITFGGSILSNLLAGTDKATHFPPPRDRPFKTGEPVRIRGGANVVCDANGLQGPSDEIESLRDTICQESQDFDDKLSRSQAG